MSVFRSAAVTLLLLAFCSLAWASTTTVFTATPNLINGGWQGNQSRQIINTADLLASGGGETQIRVTFNFGSTASSAGIASAEIGEAGATHVWDFDGNQKVLLFSGAGSISGITGTTNVVTDYVTFTYDHTKNLVIAFTLNGTSADGGELDTGFNSLTRQYYNGTDLNTTTTSPTGFTDNGNKTVFVTKVETTGAGGGALNLSGVGK